MIAQRKGNTIPVYRKFSLDKNQTVTVGSGPDNTIQFQRAGLVSRHHGRLKKTDRWIYEDLGSANGSFYNHHQLRGSWIALEPGDEIEIYGLRMIFLGDILAVSSCQEAVYGKELKLADNEPVFSFIAKKRRGTTDTLTGLPGFCRNMRSSRWKLKRLRHRKTRGNDPFS